MEVYEKIRRPVGLLSARCLYIFHPITTFVYLGVFFTIVFLFVHPAFMAAYTLLAFLLAGYFAGFGAVLQKLKAYVPFTAAFALITPLFNHRGFHILFYLFDKPITLESLCYGFYMMSFIISILLVFIVMNQVLASHKLLYLFSGIAPQTAFITGMSLRFSGVLQKKAVEFFNVQKVRDLNNPNKSSKLNKVKHSGKLLGAFCVWALEDGMLASETLRAKAYGQERRAGHKRTHYRTYVFTARDGFCAAIFLLVFIGLFTLRLKGAGAYDYFRNLTDLSFDNITRAAYLILFFYGLLPFVIDFLSSEFRRFF